MLKMLQNFRDVANVQIFQVLQMLPTFSVVANVAMLSRCCRVLVPSVVAILR